MCIAWAHLEEACFVILYYTMRDVEYTAFELIRNELDIRRALQVCKAHAIANRWDRHCDHIPTLVDMVDGEVRVARNRYVHDPIFIGSGSYVRQTYATRYRKSPHKVHATITQFADVDSEEIYALTRAIRQLERYAGSIVTFLDWRLEGQDFFPDDPDMETVSAWRATFHCRIYQPNQISEIQLTIIRR